MPHPGEKRLADWGLFFESFAEPGPRVLPVAVGGRPRQARRRARLLDGKAAEQVEVGDPGRGSVLLAEPGQQFVQRQHQVGIFGERMREA